MSQFNPIQLIQMMKQSGNPQQVMFNLLQQNMSNTPMGQNLINLIQSGNTQDIEKIARNLCAQKGLDFDKEFAKFRQQYNL